MNSSEKRAVALNPLLSVRPIWLFICVATKSLMVAEEFIQFAKDLISVRVGM